MLLSNNNKETKKNHIKIFISYYFIFYFESSELKN